jgi:hypothetical protein
MKLWTLVRWVILLAVLGWAGYTVAGAGWTYYATQEVVDKALRDASGNHRTAFATGSQMSVDALTTQVRNTILFNARHDGLPVQEGDVHVSANSAGMSARVHLSYPVVRYQGSDLLVFPMSVQRSYVPTP